MTAPEPSREDLYEAAVRAVLDLCDREELEPGDVALVPSDRIRAAVAAALLPSEEPDGDREPLVVSGPGAGTERIETIKRGPGFNVEIVDVPAPLSAVALDAVRRAVVWP